MKQQKMSRGNFLAILFVLGSVFSCIGAFFTNEVVIVVRDYYAAKNWVEYPAYIDRIEHGYKQQSKLFYHYVHNNKEFKSSRIGLTHFVMSNGSYFNKHLSEFKKHFKNETAIKCFVNPEAPEESLIDRDLRAKDIAFLLPFSLGFGGVGIGCILAITFLTFKKRDRSRGDSEYGGDMVQTVIEFKEGRSVALFKLGFAMCICVLTIPPIFFFSYSNELSDGNYLILLIFLFPIIGILLGVKNGLRLLGLIKYEKNEKCTVANDDINLKNYVYVNEKYREYKFPMFRDRTAIKSVLIPFFVVGSIFILVCKELWHTAPSDFFGIIFMFPILAVVAVFIFVLGSAMSRFLFSSTLLIHRDRLCLNHGAFGRKNSIISINDVVDITAELDATMGGKSFYRVMLTTVEDAIPIAIGLDEMQAEEIVSDIYDNL